MIALIPKQRLAGSLLLLKQTFTGYKDVLIVALLSVQTYEQVTSSKLEKLVAGFFGCV